MSVEMVFEVGFNHCCRNLISHQGAADDNLTIKISCNLLNEISGLTETCNLEFFGSWARILSFLGPDMDMMIVCQLPVEGEKTVWNESVMVTNLAGPERIETRYTISKIVVVETNSDRAKRRIEFDKKGKIVECKTIDGHIEFPNYWMDHKRKYVDKNPSAFRPLTTITADVPVINVAVAFVGNTPPGPYKFSHPTAPYVKTHVQVCDLSFRQLRLSAIRAGTDDVPSYHLHLQIDEPVEPSALPWLCVGDVLQVNTVKPVFGQRQTWNLLHKQKNFGETKIKIWPIETSDESKILDVKGKKIIDQQTPPSEIVELRQWIRERLLKDTLLSDLHRGVLAGRNEWFSGRDLVARVERINRHASSIFITDFSVQDEDPVEVRIRSSQQNFASALEYLFEHIEKCNPAFKNLYVLLRNLRVNSADNTLYCSVEHVTRVPEFCKDVQDLIKRRDQVKEEVSASLKEDEPQAKPATPSQPTESTFCFNQFIPSQWRNALRMSEASERETQATQSGYVDSSSQVAFEFVDDDEDDAENQSSQNQVRDPTFQKPSSQTEMERKRQRID